MNCFFFKIYLFTRDTHTERERERQRHRQREKQPPCREPDVGLDPGSPGSRPGLQAVLDRCGTGAAQVVWFYIPLTTRRVVLLLLLTNQTLHTPKYSETGPDPAFLASNCTELSNQ